MINLRYHIVSLTAVFLALGIGVLLGGTYLDKYTVDQLDQSITNAEERIRETRAENDRLRGQLGDARAREQALVVDGGPWLFDERLAAVPVLVVTGPGVDSRSDDQVQRALVNAGADVRGTLAMTESMLFDGDEVDEGLAEALDVSSPTVSRLRTAAYDELARAMRAAGRPLEEPVDEPATDPTTVPEGGGSEEPVEDQVTTTAPSEQPEVSPGGQPADGTEGPLPADPAGSGAEGSGDEDADVVEGAPDGTTPAVVLELLARGYLTLEVPDGGDGLVLERTGYRYVFVSEAGLSTPQINAHGALLSADEDGPLPAVVVVATLDGDDADADSARSLVSQIRSDDRQRATWSTVDDVDHFTGLTATLQLVAALPAPAAHYGQGIGAQGLLPQGQ